MYITSQLRKGLQRFWLHHSDRYRAVTQVYNNCAATHLGGEDTSIFVFPLSTIARVHDPTVIGSVALRKGPRRFCPHCNDRFHALMLTCQNSPLWHRCEHHNNFLSSFWPPWLDLLNSMSSRDLCVNWTSHKLAAYNYTSSLALWTTLEYELVHVCRSI